VLLKRFDATDDFRPASPRAFSSSCSYSRASPPFGRLGTIQLVIEADLTEFIGDDGGVH
jgi:hypothetical protein